MAYFPLFVELAGRRVLVVGGGRVALRKVEKLLPYEPEVVVVAPEIRPELENLQGVTLVRRSFFPDLLSGAALVIAAAGDTGVNHEVSALCREQGIPVNVVDDPAACTFFFPALVKRGPLSVGISTGGAAPVPQRISGGRWTTWCRNASKRFWNCSAPCGLLSGPLFRMSSCGRSFLPGCSGNG